MRGNILRFIRENELIKPGSTLVCAVSGGKDSVCLLHVMRSLQKELSITVKAAHLNHQLRGEESDRDEAFVRSLCESLSVPLTVSHADVLTRCKETGEEKTILFGLTGTGYFDMTAYEAYLNGTMTDHVPTDEELQKGFDSLPQIPQNQL